MIICSITLLKHIICVAFFNKKKIKSTILSKFIMYLKVQYNLRCLSLFYYLYCKFYPKSLHARRLHLYSDCPAHHPLLHVSLLRSCICLLQVLALVFVRKLLDFCFLKRELSWLDDLMPESKKKKEDDKKKKAKEVLLQDVN